MPTMCINYGSQCDDYYNFKRCTPGARSAEEAANMRLDTYQICNVLEECSNDDDCDALAGERCKSYSRTICDDARDVRACVGNGVVHNAVTKDNL
mmetsp:Transcript_31036/g.57352  ORF Transcript_31036/g.57352 Transcript_31036/m.57352 type:complete len:95 (+) Transcript_31036:3-287(+)